MAAVAIVAQWLRAQADHRGGGLHLCTQPSITRRRIGREVPDTRLSPSTLFLIYTSAKNTMTHSSSVIGNGHLRSLLLLQASNQVRQLHRPNVLLSCRVMD